MDYRLWTIDFFVFRSHTGLFQNYFKTIHGFFINTTNDIFLVQKGMLERYNSNGVFFQNYGSIYINENTDIISANGFKTILFSPDFGKIIQLDNRLRET
jgi:hypothetical protein